MAIKYDNILGKIRESDDDTDTTYNATSPITITGTTIAIPKADTSVNGYLSSGDWDTFNNKADSISDTTYNVTSPITLVGTTIAIPKATTSVNGYISSTDWDTFNDKSDSDTTYNATSPVDITGTTINVSQANTTTNGYLSSADWDTFNSKYDSGDDAVFNSISVAAGQKIMFEGAVSDTYLIYNTTDNKLELWVNNVKKADWGG